MLLFFRTAPLVGKLVITLQLVVLLLLDGVRDSGSESDTFALVDGIGIDIVTRDGLVADGVKNSVGIRLRCGRRVGIVSCSILLLC